jgi:hypothetical protein
MNKKILIFGVCFSVIALTYLFLYPLPPIFGDISGPFWIAHGKELTLSEPTLMLFIGIVLLGMGVYARRKFKNSIE